MYKHRSGGETVCREMEEQQSEAEVDEVDAVKEFAPARAACRAAATFCCTARARKSTQKEMMVCVWGNANRHLSYKCVNGLVFPKMWGGAD